MHRKVHSRAVYLFLLWCCCGVSGGGGGAVYFTDLFVCFFIFFLVQNKSHILHTRTYCCVCVFFLQQTYNADYISHTWDFLHEKHVGNMQHQYKQQEQQQHTSRTNDRHTSIIFLPVLVLFFFFYVWCLMLNCLDSLHVWLCVFVRLLFLHIIYRNILLCAIASIHLRAALHVWVYAWENVSKLFSIKQFVSHHLPPLFPPKCMQFCCKYNIRVQVPSKHQHRHRSQPSFVVSQVIFLSVRPSVSHSTIINLECFLSNLLSYFVIFSVLLFMSVFRVPSIHLSIIRLPNMECGIQSKEA